MIVCNFKIKHQQICLVGDKPYIVNDSNNYLKLLFEFKSSDWDNMPKYIIFHKNKKNYLFSLEADDTKYSVLVPSHVLTGNRLRFTVYGENVNDNVRITCEERTLILKDSNYTNTTDPIDPDVPDIIVVLENRVSVLEEEVSERYTKSEVNERLATKSDVGHSHTSADVTDLNSTVETEIKTAYRLLENDIRGYEGL